MIEEVEGLMKKGIPTENLLYYGLEYKYVTLFLTGKLTREQMEISLATAIHQFAKRQMTWFRGMERKGIEIEWVGV
jgi:tRNA dimethylallyltransferase